MVRAAASVADITRVDKLLYGGENIVGAAGVEKRLEYEGREVIWQVAVCRSTDKKLGKRSLRYKARRKIEKARAQMCAKVKHSFWVIKRQLGYANTCFRGLTKNAAQLVTLFVLSSLWMARRHFLINTGEVRLQCEKWLPRGVRSG